MLFYQKTEAPPDFPSELEPSPAMLRGTKLEGIIISEYMERERRAVLLAGTQRHAQDEWLFCHPDALIYPPADEARGMGVLECKCLGLSEFARVKRDGISDAYAMQLQHSFLVTGYLWGSFAVLNAERWEFLSWDVLPDADLMRSIRRQAARFWRLVEAHRNGTIGDAFPLPERLPPDDARCQRCPWRTRCQGAALMASVEEPDGADLPRDDALTGLVGEYLYARDLAAEAHELKDEAAADLKEAIGNRVGVATSAGRAHYRPTETVRIDPAAVRKTLGEAARQFERTSIVRSLRVFPAKGA